MCVFKDLELELSRSNEGISLESLTRESDKVSELEKQNRKLQIEVEYLQ